MSVVFLFPGQGSQYPGMLHQLPDHPIITATLEEASVALGKDVLQFDTEQALSSTVAVQIALLVAGVATARVMLAEGATADMVAGHSVGAFGAAVIADVFTFKDALSLVKYRGERMENAYPHGYGMGVVLGLNERQLTTIINRVSTPDTPVFLANINGSTQITIAGAIPGIEAVLASARREGARKAQLLNVSVPSHCQLLESVSIQLASALQKVPFHTPSVPYVGNRNGRVLRDPEAIREDLATSIAHPVRWHDATTLLFELGARLFIEMPPGHVLRDLARSAFPSARSISISDSGMDSAILLARREKEKKR